MIQSMSLILTFTKKTFITLCKQIRPKYIESIRIKKFSNSSVFYYIVLSHGGRPIINYG